MTMAWMLTRYLRDLEQMFCFFIYLVQRLPNSSEVSDMK